MGAEAEALLLRGGRLGVVPASFVEVSSFALDRVPPGLSLDRVARSHGWVALPPYGYDGDNQLLYATFAVDGVPTTVMVDRTWRVTLDRATTAGLPETLRWCLGLDDDVTGAPPAVRKTRMLRSVTVWEDLVKTLMTTNCSWSATVGMVTRLVESLGPTGCFPSAAAVAAAGPDLLREKVRMGYRAPSLAHLAELVATGALDPQAWRDTHVPDGEVVAQVLALPGFGKYSAEGMLGLLGRPRGPAVDSWIRARLDGATAVEITERYAHHGRWAGAALWHDVTAHWFTG